MATLLDYALCTVADVKEILNLDSGNTSKDNLIIRKINQSTRVIENYCGRRFKSADYTEYYDGIGGSELELRNRPVNSIASLSARNVITNENSFELADTEDYFIDESAGIIEFLGSFNGLYDSWKVVYNAGYDTIPEDVAEVCAQMAAYLIENGTSSSNVKIKQEGQRKVEYFDTSGSSQSLIESLGLDEMLDPYADPVISGLR